MTYETVKKLKDAGYPQVGKGGCICPHGVHHGTIMADVHCSEFPFPYTPTLEELIEECKKNLIQDFMLRDNIKKQEWVAGDYDYWDNEFNTKGAGSTPSEAVANLWIQLRKDENEKKQR